MLSISEGSKLKVEDGDEMEDEFDEYLEQSLMKEADDLGIFDQSALEAQANIYDLALKKVHKEVEKIQIQKCLRKKRSELTQKCHFQKGTKKNLK